MTAQRLAYSGPATLNGGEPRNLEIWIDDHSAVAFANGKQVGVLTHIARAFTGDRRLLIQGRDPAGFMENWEGIGEERVTTRWTGARVAWPGGKVSPGSTVTATQFGVTIHADGETTELPAARLQAVGSQRWVVDGSERFLASGRGCGCGGKRR